MRLESSHVTRVPTSAVHYCNVACLDWKIKERNKSTVQKISFIVKMFTMYNLHAVQMPHKGCARVLPPSLGNGWPIKLGRR